MVRSIAGPNPAERHNRYVQRLSAGVKRHHIQTGQEAGAESASGQRGILQLFQGVNFGIVQTHVHQPSKPLPEGVRCEREQLHHNSVALL